LDLSLQPAGNKPTSRELVPVRVLVVDDEALIRWSICMALGAAGFDAVAAGSGDEACRLAAEWPPPKVVVLDTPPDGHACELMGRLRRIYPDCRFLIMSTARGTCPTLDDTLVQMVEKPFDLGEVVRLVGEAVHQQSVR
jgi:DNA-binding NtrC family response regulator